MPPLPERYNTPEMELERININIQFLEDEQEMFGLMEQDQIKYDELIKQREKIKGVIRDKDGDIIGKA